MYLRKMGSVSLLTREGEVELAKRIEEGERRILQVVLSSSIAVEEILDLGERLKKQKIRVKEIVRDVDVETEDGEFDEEFHTDRVIKIIDKVKTRFREIQKIEEQLDGPTKLAEIKKKKLKQKIESNRNEMFELLSDLRMNKKQIERIVNKLKSFVVRVEAGEHDVHEC